MGSISWKNGIGGDWSIASDWSSGTVPTGSDDVTINATGAYIITVSTAEGAHTLDLAAAGATLLVGAPLDVGGAAALTRGVVSIAAGQTLTLSGATSFGINGNYGPSVEGPGTLLTSGAVSLVAQTGGDFTDLYVGDGAAWTNSATVTDAGLIQFGVKVNDSASFTNQASGVFDLTTDNADITADTSGDTATFDNAGVLEKTGGTGVSRIAAAVTNTGTILAASGTLEFDGGGNFGGTVETSGSGVIGFADGNFTLAAAAITADLLVEGGTVDISTPRAASGGLTETSGVLELSVSASESGPFTATRGVVSIAAGRTLTLSGATSFGIDGNYGPSVEGPGTLLTSGAVSLVAETGGDFTDLYVGDGAAWTNSATVTDAGLIQFGVKVNDSASFTNQASGVFDLTTDNADITADTSGDTATFDNAGVLEKTGGTGVSRIAAAVTNTGTILAASGTLEFDGGGNFGGTVETSGSGVIGFADGNFTLAAAAITADLLVEGGTVDISTPRAASGGLTETSGVLELSASASEFGPLTVTRGVVSIAAGQTLTLSGATSFGINGNYGPSVEGPGTLLTSGVVSLVAQTGGDYTDLYVGDGAAWMNSATVTDAGLIQFGVKVNDTASFTNQASGVFDLTTDNADITADTSGDTAMFDNAGMLEKTGGTGVSAIAAAVTNTGTILAASGTLEFDGGGNFGGTVETSGSGVIGFADGNFTLAAAAITADLLVEGGTVDISTPRAMSGGLTETSGVLELSASASESGPFTAARGVVSIAAGQTLTLSGATSFGINGNYGPSVEGPGTLLTSGAVSLVAQTGGDFTDLYVGDGAAWTNSATVTDAGLIQFGVKVNDSASFTNQASGVFDLTTDNADITADTSGDTATFDNAGVLEKTGGTGVSRIAAAVTNTGTILAASGTLEFDGGGNFGGTVETSGSGVIGFADGNFTLAAAAITADLLVEGGTVDISTPRAASGGLTETSGVLELSVSASEFWPVHRHPRGGVDCRGSDADPDGGDELRDQRQLRSLG